MTNLPIMNSAPQTAAVSRQPANAADAGDAQNTQPFGEVLARQISDPNMKDAKADTRLAADVLSQLATDTKIDKKDLAEAADTEIVPADTPSTLPADMLAALLPQVMNTATASAAAPAPAKSDSQAISDVPVTDTRGISPQRTDIAPGIKAEPTLKADPTALPAAQVRTQSFAAALTESAVRTPAASELAVARDVTAAVAVTPQPNSAALAAMQTSAANIAAAVAHPVQVTVNTPVTQEKWADEFSQKITWLASSSKDQTAELHLNPPQLGPLDVVIKVSGDQATALFTSPHAAVRDAIEQAMPRLRDMMADNGIMLGNATVSDQAPRDPNQSGAQRSSGSTGNDISDTTLTANSAPRVSPIARHNGIVDTFA